MRYVLGASLLFLVSCVSAASEELLMRNVTGGSYALAEVDQPTALVAFDEASFRKLWNSRVSEGELPAIDFPREAAVLLMSDMRSSGGWSVVPRSVTLEEDVLVVKAVIEGPPSGGIASQVLTHPWAVIAVSPVTFKSVRWDR